MPGPPTVALATWAELPGLSEDERRLLRPLEEVGVRPTAAVWSDPRVDWSAFDAVLVRSTWDYHRHRDDFLAWAGRVDRHARVWNRPRTLGWNSHKGYLLELERRGVPVVPTRLVPDLPSALAAAREERWVPAIVKPAVSASGERTYRLDPAAEVPADDERARALAGRDLLVQPYLDEVERSGERSLVFFRGSYSHAFLRGPRFAPGTGPREGAPVRPLPGELRVAETALASVPEPTLYARVDLVPDPGGTARVMEVELIEPALQLAADPAAAGRFARCILATLREAPATPR